MITRKALPRRTFLRGIGATVALPMLDAMTPAFAKPVAPVRMAFVYVPNGIDMRNWNPAYEGAFQEMPRILKPLEPFRDDVTMLGNLTRPNGRAPLAGAGDHSRCSSGYLTGFSPRTSVAGLKAGVSCDQIVARRIGRLTRFPSLEVGLADGPQTGYTHNLAWRSETEPLPALLDPRALFVRLFGDSPARGPESRSILDFVAGDARSLQSSLGPADKRKLDEYLSSIREIERQLEQAERQDSKVNPSVPANFAEHFKLLTDMVTVAFRADLTRVLTFLVTREGTSRPYPEIGIAEGHHALTHHRNDPEKMEKVTRINTYHMKQFAAWIERLKSIREGDGTLLDHSMIVYGSGLSDGDRHTQEDLPTLVVGSGAGAIKGGRRIVYRKATPIASLFATMMDRMGAPVESFDDSTGRIEGLNLT